MSIVRVSLPWSPLIDRLKTFDRTEQGLLLHHAQGFEEQSLLGSKFRERLRANTVNVQSSNRLAMRGFGYP